jgi:hypothetical protein
VLLFEYDKEPAYLLVMDGIGNPKIKGESDKEHYRKATTTPIAQADKFTIIEAALIRYFQPHFNTVYKDSFPSTNLKSLQKCYDLDFVAVSVEVDTEDIDVCIYSSKAIRNYHHVAYYDLHSETDRKSFFCVQGGLYNP